MSLPQEPVFSLIKNQFVVGWRNIIGEKYVGDSHGYTLEQTSVGTTNGAGPHNVQLFVIAADGTVIHALPGFWHPRDLAHELKFAQQLLAIWQDASLDLEAKRAACSAAQLAEARNGPRTLAARSSWQGFDAKNEQKRLAAGKTRDTFVRDADGALVKSKRGSYRLKTLNVIAHERMAARPFVPFGEFDVFAFADYGRTYYDNNKKVDGAGSTLLTPRKLAKSQRQVGKLLDAALKFAERRDRGRRARRGAKQKTRGQLFE